MFTLVGCLLFHSSYSQENFLAGYIIKSSGDTLRGYIDYRNWDKTPQRIFFKEKMEGEKNNFSPLNIKGFGVQGEMYESAIVEKEVSSLEMDALSTELDLSLKSDTAFLQTIIQGEKSLYAYKDKRGKEHLYIKNGGKYDLLIYKKTIFSNPYAMNYLTYDNNRYLGQLSLYFSDYPDIQKTFERTTYSARSVKKIFDTYYAHSQLKISYEFKREKIYTEFGALAGLSLTTLSFNGTRGVSYLLVQSFNQSKDVTGGVFFNLVIPRTQKRVLLCSELVYTSFNEKGYSHQINTMADEIYESNLAYSYLKLNALVRYVYPIGRFSLFANAGMSNGVIIKEKNKLLIDRTSFGHNEIINSKAIDSSEGYETGFIVGVGGKVKRYSLEMRYESGSGILNTISLGSKTKRYFFLLGYQF